MIRHYFHACKTSRQGLAGLLFVTPIVAMAIYGWAIFDHPFGKGLCALIGAGGVASLAAYLWHLSHPKVAFIEISETELVWNDMQGLGMRRWVFPLASITSVVEGGTEVTSEYLVLKSGIRMELPSALIPDQKAFFQALQTAAPHIHIEIGDWLPTQT
ncbi:hypothetical protein DES53_106282 [Roseimicrobium gellanilyticum]|uniref:Uncharacterized protein n=1 Tax=Roseimicrobium gellanilyticum TaxID=748857 RepID=A0A366HLD6_9BACT|nr:hypothetical protein [Roseimicrobium gellanilyticum]RBP42573.1 hypothetical protein DES53_106282 [Roseimicrobium gellanilyticum]